jgi:hypothetical protein
VGNRIDDIVNRPAQTPPPPAGKSSGEVRFAPSEIKQLGLNVERELDAIFKQARYKLNAAPRDLEPSAFTTFGYAFSTCSVAARRFLACFPTASPTGRETATTMAGATATNTWTGRSRIGESDG